MDPTMAASPAVNAQDVKVIADVLGQILNGNAVGFFILVTVVGFLAYGVVTLYKQNMRSLQECQDERISCHKNLSLLTESVIRQSAGYTHEARTLAEIVQLNLSNQKGMPGHSQSVIPPVPGSGAPAAKTAADPAPSNRT